MLSNRYMCWRARYGVQRKFYFAPRETATLAYRGLRVRRDEWQRASGLKVEGEIRPWMPLLMGLSWPRAGHEVTAWLAMWSFYCHCSSPVILVFGWKALICVSRKRFWRTSIKGNKHFSQKPVIPWNTAHSRRQFVLYCPNHKSPWAIIRVLYAERDGNIFMVLTFLKPHFLSAPPPRVVKKSRCSARDKANRRVFFIFIFIRW